MLITSLGIFGYLAKASSDTSYATGLAQSEVTRIDSQIQREENQIQTISERILGLTTGGVDVTSSVNAQVTIRDGAWKRVQGDIEYSQGQITSLRGELSTLNETVSTLRNKGVEVITLDEGGIFDDVETEKIDYIAQANELFEQQTSQREQIRDDIKEQQGNIDKYRDQAQDTINGANAEINRLQTLSTGNIDEIIIKTEEYNTDIDVIYDDIKILKDERFVFEQEILGFEAEIGPIKYVAEVIYGQEESVKYLDNAVRWVIFALIFVFDPLAILLLITSTGLIVRKLKQDKPKIIEHRYKIQIPKKKVNTH
jgi:chromosome segregation ATPase